MSGFQKSNQDVSTYDNRLLAEVISKKTEAYLNRVDKKILPNSNYLALLAAFQSLVEIRKVIDFGGAAGVHYHLSKSFVPQLESWTVIETRAMIEQQVQKKVEELNFCTVNELIEGDTECDLLYLSSSLQYVDNPTQTLNDLLSTKPKIVLISRTPFNRTETNVEFTQFSKLSSNGPGPLPSGYKDCKVAYKVNLPSYKQITEVLEENYIIQWTCSENEEMIGPDKSRYQYLSILAKSKQL